MRSAQIINWGEPLEMRDVDMLEPEGRDIRIKVTSCGVCHSDLHIWDGFFDMGGGNKMTLEERGLTLPFTMGHEALGMVDALGPEASGVNVGESYIVYPWIGCGNCAVCQAGDDLLCLNPRTVGTRRPGGYGEYVLVPDAKYLVPYDGLAEELACTYACSGITAFSALNKLSFAGAGDHVLTVGAGGVGLNGVSMFHGISDAKLIVADVDAGKRELALEAGADHVVDNGADDALQQIMELSGGGVVGAIDFVGAPATSGFAMQAVRRGGKLVVVGLYGGALPLPLASLPLRMMTIQGSYVGTLQDLKDLVALAQAGKVKPLPITPRPLSDAPQVVQELKDGKISGRVVLKP